MLESGLVQPRRSALHHGALARDAAAMAACRTSVHIFRPDLAFLGDDVAQYFRRMMQQ